MAGLKLGFSILGGLPLLRHQPPVPLLGPKVPQTAKLLPTLEAARIRAGFFEDKALVSMSSQGNDWKTLVGSTMKSWLLQKQGCFLSWHGVKEVVFFFRCFGEFLATCTSLPSIFHS